MSITLKDYTFDGVYASISSIKDISGVYAVLSKNNSTGKYSVVDIGESQNIRTRLASHDREVHWKKCTAIPEFAVFYCNEGERMKIERELRLYFSPPCGDR